MAAAGNVLLLLLELVDDGAGTRLRRVAVYFPHWNMGMMVAQSTISAGTWPSGSQSLLPLLERYSDGC